MNEPTAAVREHNSYEERKRRGREREAYYREIASRQRYYADWGARMDSALATLWEQDVRMARRFAP